MVDWMGAEFGVPKCTAKSFNTAVSAFLMLCSKMVKRSVSSQIAIGVCVRVNWKCSECVRMISSDCVIDESVQFHQIVFQNQMFYY